MSAPIDLVAPLLLLVASAAALWAGVRAWTLYERGRRTLAWPSVRGEITESSLRASTEWDSDNRVHSYFAARVCYVYSVAGESMAGTRVTLDATPFQTQSDAEEIVGRYGPGSMVDVYYNPVNPSQAVLERGPNMRLVLLHAGAALLILFIGSRLFAPYLSRLFSSL